MTGDLAVHPDHVVAPARDRYLPHLTTRKECNCWCERCALVERGQIIICRCPDCEDEHDHDRAGRHGR